MKTDEIISKVQPFGALIAPSSLVVAVLYLAGFSYRWSYYYNFGLQNLVFNFSFQSFLMTSMEMIRQPRNLLITALSLICSLVLVNLLIAAILRGEVEQSEASPESGYCRSPRVGIRESVGDGCDSRPPHLRRDR